MDSSETQATLRTKHRTKTNNTKTRHGKLKRWVTQSSRPWSYGSWIYNYLCNQCLLPLLLWIRILIRVRCTTLCNKVCQWLATGRWFSTVLPVSSTNKTDHHDITEILLKVAFNTIKQTNKHIFVTHLICTKCIFVYVHFMFSVRQSNKIC